MDKPLQRDVTVSGAMSFILHVSRIAGIAPLTIKSVRDGWNIRISRNFIAYNYVVTIFLSICSAVFGCIDRDGIIDGYDPSSNSSFMIHATRIMMVTQITVQFTTTYNSNYRLSHMVDCLSQLKQINSVLDRLISRSTSSEVKIWIMAFMTMAIAYLAVFLEYSIYMYDVVAENDTVPILSYAFFGVMVAELQLAMLPIQFGVVVMRMASTQRRLNKALKKLLREMQNNCFSRDAKKINQLADIYCSLCGIIRKFNESNGVSLMALLLYVGVGMFTTPYFIVSVLFKNELIKLPLIRTVSLFVYGGYCMSMLIMATEPCQKSHYQLKLTKHLIKQTLRAISREATATKYELKMFRRHILLNPVRFCPMKLIRFDRSLSITVMSTLLTYLSVIINL